ncbi:MAG TPA: hypothetical protein CFH81_06570 [Sulfurovum sp. UBA12169]|nr:MAG TPA: hypothetical protein CFH81_06570 [Sulfurovum sp. UBA12169]
MKRIILSLVTTSFLATSGAVASTNAELEAKLKILEEQMAEIKKELTKTNTTLTKTKSTLNEVKAHDAFDNIKWSMDFRNSVDFINYDYNSYEANGEDLSGTSASNDGLLTSRLYLNMKAAPTDKLMFSGQLAMYGIWGGELHADDAALKTWVGSSRADDTLFRIRQAYFVWSDTFGEDGLPYAFSIGRRQSTDGFLANHRENMTEPGSPLAHITNMEVDGAMLKLDLDEYVLPGSFVKFVYGRAHSGGIETLFDSTGIYEPYAQEGGDVNENVDFFVVLGSLYNDGQYNLMFENATIFDTKGQNLDTLAKAVGAGTANLSALSLQADGVGNGINDFLDETTAFISLAATQYMPDNGHQLLGSTDDETGYSYWLGFTIPDMITEDGRFGFEFNHGSKYWTPMTWAEDTAIGSKVAVRGDALEAYWNFNLFGSENLASQIRYTYAQHDYTPSIRCAGWVTPQNVDIEASDLRFFVNYQY